KHRDKMCVIDTGRPAVTHWEVLDEAHGRFTFLQLRLETGRTHQIRVHMAHIGHPVLGDPLYGSGIERQLKLRTQGQLLQAFRLSLAHPATQGTMHWELPTDPAIQEAWRQLST